MHECSDYDIGSNGIDTTPEGSQMPAPRPRGIRLRPARLSERSVDLPAFGGSRYRGPVAPADGTGVYAACPVKSSPCGIVSIVY